MISDTSQLNVYLAPGVTDMRKSIDGLALVVSETLGLEPFSESLFVFCNRGRDKLKILHWQTNGFWLYYRRLEKGRFNWPKQGQNAKAITLSRRKLNWLLDGLPLYRQEFILKRIGADIRRATLTEWMIRCAELLKPIYQALRKRLIEQSQLHANENGEPGAE